ncbi:hypothetical protein MY8738_006544 [Beauveria namnaoensis]
MPETLLSILCSEPWRWDSFASSEITFNQDGTGKLTCRAELNIWIAAEIEWKAHDAASLQQQQQIISTSQQDAAPLAAGPIKIDLTLTKRRIPHFGDRGADVSSSSSSSSSSGQGINEEALEEAAFLPKTYTLRLEQGHFHAQSYTPEQAPQHTPRFQLRLTFDPSPYPPREEWLRPERAPDSMRFWEWTQFCSRQIGYF